jgi:hypothetical protein
MDSTERNHRGKPPLSPDELARVNGELAIAAIEQCDDEAPARMPRLKRRPTAATGAAVPTIESTAGDDDCAEWI